MRTPSPLLPLSVIPAQAGILCQYLEDPGLRRDDDGGWGVR